MSEENTISIKKDLLWKYATFLLIAIVVIGGFIMFKGDGSGGTGAAVNAGGATGGAVDLSVFTDNPNLYPSLGPEDAENVVIEFSDFQCPYCAIASGLPTWTTEYQSQYADLIDVAGKVQDLAAEGKVRFIYVSMSFLGQESVYAAQAGLCANKQGKFWEMHDAIFTASNGPSENDGKYSKENLKKIAAGINGLDTGEFNSCLDDDETLSDVQKSASQASTAASGTPTFYVNGVKMGASWNQISAAIGA